jgi:pyruvate dehydrogenase E1 component alpha subunit
MYRRMALIRQFEDRLYLLFLQGLVPDRCTSTRASASRQVCWRAEKEDMVFSTHRPVGHAIAKGVSLIRSQRDLGQGDRLRGRQRRQMHLGDRRSTSPSTHRRGKYPDRHRRGVRVHVARSDNVAVISSEMGQQHGRFHEGSTSQR